MRLTTGELWPMPITLDVSKEQAEALKLQKGSRVTLRDPRDDNALAIITGESPLRLLCLPTPSPSCFLCPA